MLKNIIFTITASIACLFYFDVAFADGCDDFKVYIDNRTKSELYVVYTTPNEGTIKRLIQPGETSLGTAANQGAHKDTWQHIQIFKADKIIQIYEGTLAKNYSSGSYLREGADIYRKQDLIYDANYTVKGNIDTLGWCKHPIKKNTPGEWHYTVYLD